MKLAAFLFRTICFFSFLFENHLCIMHTRSVILFVMDNRHQLFIMWKSCVRVRNELNHGKKNHFVNWTGRSICLFAQDKKRKRFFFLQSWLLIICSFICNFNCNHCTIEPFRSHLFDFQTFSNDNVTIWRRLTWYFPFDS